MTPEFLALLNTARGTLGNSIGRGGQPYYTIRELGIALAGLKSEERSRCYSAYMMRVAGTYQERHILFGCLLSDCFDLSSIERWPSRIRNQKYHEHLVRLAVLEEMHPQIGTLRLHALAMSVEYKFENMDADLWDKSFSRKYEGLRDIIQSWVDKTERLCSEALGNRPLHLRKPREAKTNYQ